MILKFTIEGGIIYINSNHVRRYDYCKPNFGTASIVFIMEFDNGERATFHGKDATRLHEAFTEVFEVVDLDKRTTDQEEQTPDNE